MLRLDAATDQLIAVGGFQVHEKLAGVFIPAFIGWGEMLCHIFAYFKAAFINTGAHIPEAVLGPDAVVLLHGRNCLFDNPAYGTAPACMNGGHRPRYGIVNQDRRAIGDGYGELNACYIGHQGIEPFEACRCGNCYDIGAMYLVSFCDVFEWYPQRSKKYQVVLHDTFRVVLRSSEVERRIMAGAYTAMSCAFGGDQLGKLIKYLWFAEYRLFVGCGGGGHSSEIDGKQYQN